MDSYQVEKKAVQQIALNDTDAAPYQNTKANTPHTARMAHEQALGKVMQIFLKDDVDFYKQFVQNSSFHRFLSDAINSAPPQSGPPA